MIDREREIDEQLALRGPTVLLRPPTEADVEPLWEAVHESIPEVSAWMVWCHEGYEPEEARMWVRATREARGRGEECAFVITDRSTGVLLGACGLNHVEAENRRANLGYWVRTSATGRGIATEAAGLVARFGLTVLGLSRVEIVAAVPNQASQRVAEKLGAVREGVLRNRFWLAGQPVDAALYSLVPADLEPPSPGHGTDGEREPR